jgi:hypothetical protein
VKRLHSRRFLAAPAFGLLALVVELGGRSLTERLDVGRHVSNPSYERAQYYPALLIGVKICIALLLARLTWRVLRARAIERAALRALGPASGAAPRVRVQLSARLWLAFLAATSVIYLVQCDAERLADGRWALFFPWVHTSALPVFAVLSVLAAVAWRAVRRWLSEYEGYAESVAVRARLLARMTGRTAPFPQRSACLSPRRLFGLSFESRPPPCLA